MGSTAGRMINQFTGNGLTLVPSLKVPVATNCAEEVGEEGLTEIDCNWPCPPTPPPQLEKDALTRSIPKIRVDLLIPSPEAKSRGPGSWYLPYRCILPPGWLPVNQHLVAGNYPA